MPFAIKHNKRIKVQGSLETLRLTHSELPSNERNDTTHHYLGSIVRLCTYRSKIIKQVITSIHRVVTKHCPKHKEFIRPSGSYLFPTPNCTRHYPLEVPKHRVVNVTSLIGTGIVLC